MCGIAGILNFTHHPVSAEQIQAMTDSIMHRGPDGEGHYRDNNLALGHRRLSIIDLTSAGHQPMISSNQRFIITYNGEVYNFKEIRSELVTLGYNFYSNTDTEVVLNAYIQWGKKCLNKFNGMFAFAIWDKQDKKLFLARDRYGVKPLYYYHTENCLIFGSEIKAITASGLYKNILDLEGLVEYLTFQNFFTDRTLFKDIKILKAGCFLEITSEGRVEYEQYWDFNFCGSLKVTQEHAIEELDCLFKQAVERQVVSDVPVNAYLSGGIDSGAITMIASKILPHLRSFTVGFDLSSASGLELSFDERTKAEHISYLAKTEHYEMVLKAGDMERCMDKYIKHLEEPRVGQSYSNYYAAKLASKFGKVVLSGAGGDELFGGYPWRYFYTEDAIDFDNFIDQYYLKWQRLIPNNLLEKLLAPIWNDVKHVSTRDIFANVFKTKDIYKNKLTPQEALNNSLYLEAKTFLHGLLIVEDKLSMAHGLEARVPFLDNNLVDFALKIHTDLKIVNYRSNVDENDLFIKHQANKHGKHIFRQTLSKYLDQEVINNKKQGFSPPDASWFRGESIDYINRELKDTPDIFNANIVQEIFREHCTGEKNNRLAVWSLLYLKKIFKLFEV